MRKRDRGLTAPGWRFVALSVLGLFAWPAWTESPPGDERVVTFVCDHGAAKSVLAAALFNRLATERGAHAHAVARGIVPTETLQPETVAGLGRDGLSADADRPRPVTQADEVASSRVVTIDVAEEPAYLRTAKLREWDGVPPVSQGYAAARDDLARRVGALLDELEGRP